MTKTNTIFAVMCLAFGMGLYVLAPETKLEKCSGPVTELFWPCVK